MRAMAVFVALWGLGCSTATPLDTSEDSGVDGSNGLDGAIPRDAGGDGRVPDRHLSECGRGQLCADGLMCLGGRCQADPCDAMTTLCQGGRECIARCVPTGSSSCVGGCGPVETCFGGVCVPGCFPSPCEGVTCGTGQHCDASRGGCVDTVLGSGTCPEGHIMHLSCAFSDPCADVTCANGERCIGGTCIEDPCAGVSCMDRGMPTGSCVNGVCVDTCDCGDGCPAGRRCIFGRCECERSCPVDGICGSSDGCGGLCHGACPAGEFCRDGVCECQPFCPPEAACGMSDGCGGFCDGGCPLGEFCDEGACRCDPLCSSADTCGAIDARCGVRCDVGVCPEGQECRDGECQCAPRCDGAVCGASDGCGGHCNEGRCGIGEFCDTGVCVPTYCDPGCGCGEACVRGTCRSICSEGQTLCGCSGCCDAGTMCDPRTGTCSLDGPF